MLSGIMQAILCYGEDCQIPPACDRIHNGLLNVIEVSQQLSNVVVLRIGIA